MLQQQKFAVDLDKYKINNNVNFDSDAALNENNLVLAKSTKSSATSGSVVTNFRPNNTNNNPIYPYVGQVDGKTIYFDSNGVSKDGNIQIVIADAEIDKQTIGNNNILTRTVTVGGEEETITISLNSLNFREQVAMNVLNKFLEKEKDPYASSNARIKMLITRAFDYAQEFINQAASHRSADTISAESIYKVQIINDEKSSLAE